MLLRGVHELEEELDILRMVKTAEVVTGTYEVH